MKHDNRIVLCIGDTHLPYQHPDLLKFLRALKYRFKPTRVIHLGDELDNSALSFHETDPEGLGANEEFSQSKRYFHGMIDVFPEGIDFIESNHGSLAYRKCRAAGIPAYYLKSYQDLLEVDKEKYRWHPELKIKLPNGKECLFVHSLGANALNNAKERGCCLVQGHHHTAMKIDFYGEYHNIKWAMQLPCIKDPRNRAFNYSKKFAKMPKLGAGLIINGYPMLVPMPLNKAGRFTQLFD